MKLSVIVPVFNEENTIKELLKSVSSVKFQIPFEIIVVDDGSRDDTYNRIMSIPDLPKNIRVISYKKNKGKGYAIREGIRNSNGDIIIIQDADLEYNPNQIPSLIEPITQSESKIIYGSRFLGTRENLSLSHLVGNIFLTKATNILFGSNLTDMETCYKAIHRDALNDIDLESDGFEIEGEITAKLLKEGYKIKEMPIAYSARKRTAGKKIKWRDGVKTFFTMLKVKFPLLQQFTQDYPLEVIARYIRARKVEKEISRNTTLLDIGCGFSCYFLRRIKSKIKNGYGFDSNIKDKKFSNLEIKNFTFKDSLPYESNFFDTVTMMATFEHFDNIYKLLAEIKRVLKTNGKIIMTVPSEKSKSLLEFLANLRILNPKEIFDHKRYLSQEELFDLFREYGFNVKKVENFELGYNCLYVFEKTI